MDLLCGKYLVVLHIWTYKLPFVWIKPSKIKLMFCRVEKKTPLYVACIYKTWLCLYHSCTYFTAYSILPPYQVELMTNFIVFLGARVVTAALKGTCIFSLSFLCYRYSESMHVTVPAGCQWFLKQSIKAPSNLQSLASVLPQASPVMGLVAHDLHHVTSCV